MGYWVTVDGISCLSTEHYLPQPLNRNLYVIIHKTFINRLLFQKKIVTLPRYFWLV